MISPSSEASDAGGASLHRPSRDQTSARRTTIAAAAAMSWTDAHSRTEWYSCPPVKMFGVGSPISLSREPSVPPRIGLRIGSIPSARIAASAAATTSGTALQVPAHVAVLVAHVELEPGARLGGRRPRSAVRSSSATWSLEQVVVEVAEDQPDLGLAGGPGQLVGVDEPLAVRGRLRRQRVGREAPATIRAASRSALTSLPVA